MTDSNNLGHSLRGRGRILGFCLALIFAAAFIIVLSHSIGGW
jgi:hypothetical protein